MTYYGQPLHGISKTVGGIETKPSSILITSGAQQALHLIVQCLLKPGDAVAIEDPSYNFNLPIFKTAGLHIHYLPVNKDGINRMICKYYIKNIELK